MSASFIAELSPVYCCLVDPFFVLHFFVLIIVCVFVLVIVCFFVFFLLIIVCLLQASLPSALILLLPMAILNFVALLYYIKLFRHINKKVFCNHTNKQVCVINQCCSLFCCGSDSPRFDVAGPDKIHHRGLRRRGT